MKKKVVSVGAAALALSGGFNCAQAQSNVTLFGVADVGLEFANNSARSAAGTEGNSVVRMTSGNLSGSRWGLRGVEDLGGGLKGVFLLESGFTLDNGAAAQGGRLFGRGAYVGLQNDYGTLTFGRHWTTFFDFGLAFDPMIIAGRYSILANAPEFASRADNSVKYTGKFGGLTVSGLYSLTNNGNEIPGNYTSGREIAALVSYATGPLSVGASYDQINNLGTSSDQLIRRATAAGTYAFGDGKVFLGYRWAKAYDGASLPGAQAANTGSNLYWAGVTYSVTPALSVAGAVYYQDFRKSSADPWNFVALVDYAFSKRTDVYTSISYVKNKNGSNLGVAGFNNAGPFDNGFVQNGANQFGITAGIRHKF